MSLLESFFKWLASLFNKITKTTTTMETTTESTDTTTTVENIGNKKAVCIGINDYKESPLNGCINDEHEWSSFLNSKDFNVIHYLDAQSPRGNIIEALDKLIGGAKEGDELVVTYSGHGSNVPDIDGDEIGGRDQTWYLYDGNLVDDRIREILNKLPKGVKLTIFSDSCHGGSVTRSMLLTMNNYRWVPRYMPPKDDIEAISVASLPLKRTFAYPEEGMNHILISGCKSTEYCWDAVIDGKPCGAFSYYALKVLRENPKITYNDFYKKLRSYLPSSAYGQTPQLEGKEELKNCIMFE